MNRFHHILSLAAVLLLVSASHGIAGVVAYYHFEEGTPGSAASASPNAILDSSGHNFHGAAVGGPVYSAGAPVVGGQTSLSFDGSTQRIAVPDYSLFNLNHSMTLEAMVYLEALQSGNSGGNILFRGDNIAGFDPWRLTVGLAGTGSVTIGFGVTSYDHISAPKSASVFMTVPLQQWMHVAATLDDATGVMNIYLDGVLKSTLTTSIRASVDLSDEQVRGIGIGGLQDGALAPEFLHGMLDEVRISDTALTPAQFVPEPTLAGWAACTAIYALGARRRRNSRRAASHP